MGRRARGVSVGLVGAVALASAGAAMADKEKVHLTAAGQAAARAAVVRRADLGAAPGWTGGMKKPTLSGGTLACPGFNPKQSDLVLNGAAESVWKNGGIEIDSEAQVLQTAQMVRLDWQRTVLAPQVISCLRRSITNQLPASARLVSVRRRAFPKVATFARAYRIVTDVTVNGRTIPIMFDFVLVGTRRTEITLMTTAPLAGAAPVAAAELRLAVLLVHRARA